MKTAGIIAEYNPFHRGHAHHMERTRAASGAEAVVAVMSGDFVQRGEAACFDKHVRAHAAVLGGADLVIELPLPWCCAAAERFARGAVSLLAAAGCVEVLSFGSETGDIAALERAAARLDEPETDARIRGLLQEGMSYAAARHAAIGGGAAPGPNDILALEYLRALRHTQSGMRPLAVVRTGAQHDASGGTGDIRSASELRRRMAAGEEWLRFVPGPAAEYLAGCAGPDAGLLEAAFISRLRRLEREDFARLPDTGEGLGNRIYRAVQSGRTVAEILELARSKRYALSRLRRILCCAVLDMADGLADGTPPYIRVLAANRTGAALLSAMEPALPVITKPAHANRLPEPARRCFELNARARAFYTACMYDPTMREPLTDWKKTPYMQL